MEHKRLIAGFDKILHGGDYNPDQWLQAPDIIDEDFRLMKLSGCNFFSIGIFAWTSYEPEEGHYNFDWLDGIMDRMAKAGNKVALSTPSGAKPAWMSERYPEIRRVNRDGLRAPHQGRHNHCWSSPVYREKVRAINARLAERYSGHPALGLWHISNEYSGECFCDLCLRQWHQWLEQKYGSTDALNDAWWAAFWSHTFTSFSQIDPRDGSIDAMRVDYLRFNSDQCLDFIKGEVAAVREHSQKVPTTINLMGTFPWLDYPKLVRAVDIVSDDQYPGYDPEHPDVVRIAADVSFKSSIHRCLKPDRPWMLMESCPEPMQWKQPTRLKRPGIHQLEMLQALGHGAEGTGYFQWRKGRGGCEKLHGAVVDHAGHEHTRTFRAVTELSQAYDKLSPILGSSTQSDVAVLYDWEVRWGFEASEGLRNKDPAYQEVAVDHYQALSRQGVSIDVIGCDHDFSKYKLLILPQLWMLKSGVSARIRGFVEAGGSCVATYYLGGCDESNRCFLGGFPGDGLQEVFGIWHEETDWLREDMTRRVAVSRAGRALGLRQQYRVGQVCGVIHPRGAKSLASYAEDFYEGRPALTEHAFGAGTAYYQAAWLGPELFGDFYSGLVERLKIPRLIHTALPEGVFVQRRVKDDQEFLFLQNFSAKKRKLVLPGAEYDNLLTGEVLDGKVKLSAWGSTVLQPRGPKSR